MHFEEYKTLCAEFNANPEGSRDKFFQIIKVIKHPIRNIDRFNDNGINDIILGFCTQNRNRVANANAYLPELRSLALDILMKKPITTYDFGINNLYMAMIIDSYIYTRNVYLTYIVPLLLAYPDGYKWISYLRRSSVIPNIDKLIDRGCDNNHSTCMNKKITNEMRKGNLIVAIDLLIKFKSLGYTSRESWTQDIWWCQNKSGIIKYQLSKDEMISSVFHLAHMYQTTGEMHELLKLYNEYPEQCHHFHFALLLYKNKLLKFHDVIKYDEVINPREEDWEVVIDLVSSGLAKPKLLRCIDPIFIHSYMLQKIKNLTSIKNLGIANAITSKILELAF